MKNWVLLLLLLLNSCSYHWYAESMPWPISLTFIEGDEDGALTRAIVSRLYSVGISTTSASQAKFRLDVQLMPGTNDQIGYRKDRQKVGGKVRKDLVACEGRRNLSVEVSLYDCIREQIVRGPYILFADQDYDYVDGDSLRDLIFFNKAGQQETVLSFSLGQLESNEAAVAAASRPLYAQLAQKIVDSISSEW